MDERDELLDRKITERLSGEAPAVPGTAEPGLGGCDALAAEISRVLMEQSPRLSPAAQMRQLAALREHARANRARQKFRGLRLLTALPRWAQMAAVALMVVLVANGISIASASSLPGSPLYTFKRLSEQGNVLLTPTAGERARIWMSLARIRLDEVQRLVAADQRVDSATLDGIDQSILNALSEIAATRGAERLALLEELTQLTIRQQDVLNALAGEALPEDRPRFQSTERLLGGVASFAGVEQEERDLAPVPTVTATETEGLLPSRTVNALRTPAPSATAEEGDSQRHESASPPSPTRTSAPPSNTVESPEPQKTGTPGPGNDGPPAPEKGDAPKPPTNDGGDSSSGDSGGGD